MSNPFSSLINKVGSFSSLVRSDVPKSIKAYITPLDPGTDSPSNKGGDMRCFQYYPESVKDNKVTNWQPKEIPGLSHPLYQWTSCGAREIGFSVIFTRDRCMSIAEKDRLLNYPPSAGFNAPGSFSDASGPSNIDTRNVDIPSAVAWLRSFKYPEYNNGGSFPGPPRKLLLGMPGLRLNHGAPQFSVNEILCIMLQAEVSYDSFFNDGTPRMATVQLNFAEIIQYQGKVRTQFSETPRTLGLAGYKLTDKGFPKG